MSRIDLPDGQWAQLRERPTHAQLNVLRRALLRAGDEAEAGADVALAYVSAYVEAWEVKDLAGNQVPLDTAATAPDDIVSAIAGECKERWLGRPDPKDLIVRSPITPPAQP